MWYNIVTMRKECVVVKTLTPTGHKCLFLDRMQERYAQAVQHVLDLSHENGKTSSIVKLHKGCYYTIREQFDLPSDYARMALRQAQGMIHTYWGLVKSKHFKKTSWPTVDVNLPLGLGCNAYRLFRNSDRWVLRVSTGKHGQYIWLPLCVPKRYLDTLSLAQGDAQIYQRGGKWYVQLPIRYPTDTPAVSDGAQFFGVDLGIAKVATLVGPNTVKFWSGRAIQDRRRRFQTYRARMQRKGRLDKVRASKGKEQRWQRDANHKISRELVNVVAGTPGGVIVLEKLDGIRSRVRGSKRFNRMMSNWAFRQLADMIVYKAERAGIPVVWVDPRKTSQTCSRCGHATRANRPDQAHFRCVSCGYQVNSDYNAALNISRKGLYASFDAPPDMARASSEVPGARLQQGHLMTGQPSTS